MDPKLQNDKVSTQHVGHGMEGIHPVFPLIMAVKDVGIDFCIVVFILILPLPGLILFGMPFQTLSLYCIGPRT